MDRVDQGFEDEVFKTSCRRAGLKSMKYEILNCKGGVSLGIQVCPKKGITPTGLEPSILFDPGGVDQTLRDLISQP